MENLQLVLPLGAIVRTSKLLGPGRGGRCLYGQVSRSPGNLSQVRFEDTPVGWEKVVSSNVLYVSF